MSATTTLNCQRCGLATDTLDDREHCPHCHMLDAYEDFATAAAASDFLEASIRSALEHLHPDDVLRCVWQTIAWYEQHDGNPRDHRHLAELRAETRSVYEARKRASNNDDGSERQ